MISKETNQSKENILQKPVINGLVLSGGQSSRMGTDKGEIYYHDKSQRRYLYDMMLPFCEAVFISCNNEQSKQIIDMPVIEDRYINIGPLNGILSAFQANANTAWLTVACDLPFLNQKTIAYLVDHRNHSKIATVFYNEEEKFIEPLITIWEPAANNILLKFLAEGCYSPSKILSKSDVEMIHVPNALALKNINTKEEYSEAISLIKKNNQHNFMLKN